MTQSIFDVISSEGIEGGGVVSSQMPIYSRSGVVM